MESEGGGETQEAVSLEESCREDQTEDSHHKKLTKWLVSNYETILLPKFETSDMVTRGQRRIGSKTARQMLTWSHYRFQ